MRIIRGADDEPHRGVFQQISDDAYIGSRRPTVASYGSRREFNQLSRLTMDPAIGKHVALHEHALCVFEFEAVFDGPIVRIRFVAPARVFVKIIPDDGNVRGNQVWNYCSCAAEHDVFAGRFEKIILNEKRPRTVPALNGLTVTSGGSTGFMDFANVAIQYSNVCAVDGNSPANILCRAPVYVAAVDDDIVRGLCHGVWQTAANLYQAAHEVVWCIADARSARQFKSNEAEIVNPCRLELKYWRKRRAR